MNQNVNLDLIPKFAVFGNLYFSQYDVGRTATINLLNGTEAYTIPVGATVKIQATKPSGLGFNESCTFSGNVVTVVSTETMTDEAGRIPCELRIEYNGDVIGTANFLFNVERSPHPEGTTDGTAESVINEITLALESALDDIEEKAEEALASIPEDYTTLSNNVTYLMSQIDNKYDRYETISTPGLSLDMFDICPSMYSIVTYQGSDCLQHGNTSGATWIFSKFKPTYTDIVFKVTQRSVRSTFSYVLAANQSNSLGLQINATSNNFGVYSSSGITAATGQLRNPDCRSVVADDTLHFIQDGTKVALYLVDNNTDVPIFADEWVDIYQNYSSYGFDIENVGFGYISNNSARNDPLIYDFAYIEGVGDHFMDYDEVDARLTSLENGFSNPYDIDLILFMGQSNMAGRGTGSQAPSVISGAGFEFRAITDPTKLYPIEEPFGVGENVSGSIDDRYNGVSAKSGDLVPSFVNAYFANAKHPVVGVSASEGATRITSWQPNTNRYNDAVSRYNAAVTWLGQNGYSIRHKYILWCQGESDGDDGMSGQDYKTAFETMAQAWFGNGIEKIFVIKIGNYNGSGTQDYGTIMTAQNEICQNTENVVMASTDYAGMKDRGLMNDDFHYKQAGYNEVGMYAGINVSIYANTNKEPTMYDTQNGSLYFSHKN